MKRRKNIKTALISSVVLFVSIAVIIMITVFIYDAARSEYPDNNPAIAGIMLVTIIFFALVCAVIDVVRRKIMTDDRVERILSVTDKIAEGDFSARLNTKRSYRNYDEYDYIAENINKMSESLRQNEILKTDFISNVSHEIKTPLAVIMNYATALSDNTLDEDTRRSYAKTLVSTSKRLSCLVSDILKMNRLEHQEIKEQSETVRLDEMLAQALIDLEDRIDDKNLALECDMDEIAIRSHPSYLEIVWNNLLTNAIKFTEPGGKIGVSVKSVNGKAEVKITDTGCGISEETGTRIFEKFYQGDTSHSGEGNGLGLALVKRVIDLLGGEISVESELGKGSVFTVTLKGTEE